jgi:hypothetical protein
LALRASTVLLALSVLSAVAPTRLMRLRQCTRKLKAGHTSPFTSVRVEKTDASDGRARLSCTAEGSAQTYSIYGLCGRGQPVGPVTARSSDGGGIATDRAAARPVQVLLCPGSYLVASNLEFDDLPEGIPHQVWLTSRTYARQTGLAIWHCPRLPGR